MRISSAIPQLRTTDLAASMRFHTAKVGLTLEFVDAGEHFHLYFETEDAEIAADALRRNGVRLVKDVHETAWGTREFAIEDDQGHTLYFGERR